MNCDQHSTSVSTHTSVCVTCGRSRPGCVTTAHDKVAEFHRVFGHAINEAWSPELAAFRMNRITEEYKEVTDALWSDDLAHIAQELADLVYVAYGTAIALGINLDRAVTEVHQANMRKLDANGRPHYRSDGKVLKPAGWTPPDCSSAVLDGAL